MANKRNWMGGLVLVIVLVFGMTVIGCDKDGDDDGGGGGGGCSTCAGECCKSHKCPEGYCNSYGCICP